MPVNLTNMFSDEVRVFLDAVSQGETYRMISCGDMPAESEIRFCDAIKQSRPISQQEVVKIRSQLDQKEAYFLVNFARRMAVHAARINDVGILKLCTLGFVIDDNWVDWRDILMDLSVVEDCAARLGTNIESVFGDYLFLASERRQEIIKGYFSRSQGMRGLKIMRVAVSGSGHELTYTRIPWG